MCHVQMQKAYEEYNDRVRATGRSRGHFMVDLCRPGHLTACLRNFQEATGCSDENWESQFGEPSHRTLSSFLADNSVGEITRPLFRSAPPWPCKHSSYMAVACAGELWTSADMVDCILAYAATALVDKMTDPRSQEGREMLEAVKADARASKQFLLLSHL